MKLQLFALSSLLASTIFGAVIDSRNPKNGPKRDNIKQTIIPQNERIAPYWVDGTKIPEVDFDIGESYAGLLPVSDSPYEFRQLYFWFFPSSNPDASNDITIWLNGGPGCSSLEGLIQENGPFLWQYGTIKPVQNPYSWTNLTNMVWIDQPVGTGFSQGFSLADHEEQVATQFLGFWKNFVDLFDLHERQIFMAGESYAGQYVSYISDAMLNREDKTYFNLDSILFYDATIGPNGAQRHAALMPYLDYHSNLFNFNATFKAELHTKDEACGWREYREKYLVYPPAPGGHYPHSPLLNEQNSGCNLWEAAKAAAEEVNPCFNIFHIATTCPLLWDVLGNPGTLSYRPKGMEIYFNRPDVQRAINAPVRHWEARVGGVMRNDKSLHGAVTVLPGVIDRLNRTVIVHGAFDYTYIVNGTLLVIQNMTWGGMQGFQSPPRSEFYVPRHHNDKTSTTGLGQLAGAAVMGVTHTERKLTFVETWGAGHMVPQYAPSAAYRQLEFVLGRIPSLEDHSDFTTQKGDFGNGVAINRPQTVMNQAYMRDFW